VRTGPCRPRVTPWERPRLVHQAPPISSKKRCGWVIRVLGSAAHGVRSHQTMARPERALHGRSSIQPAARLSGFRFPGNRIDATPKAKNPSSEKQRPMIDQQIEIPTKAATPPPSSPSRTWWYVFRHHFNGRRRSARNAHCAPASTSGYRMLPNRYYRSASWSLGRTARTGQRPSANGCSEP